MRSKYILIFLINYLFYLGQTQLTKFECIDTWTDFEEHKWRKTETGDLKYAASSEELPPILQNLQANGIFYINSEGRTDSGQGVAKFDSTISNLAPYYLYVKYYAHVKSPKDQEITVYPEHEQVYHYLPLTHNFTWGEALVQIDPFLEGTGDYIGTWVWLFDVDEYFLIDKLILAQGFESLDIEEVKDLCLWGATTTTTDPEIVTTTDGADTTTIEVETTTDEAVSTTPEVETTTVEVETTTPEGNGTTQSPPVSTPRPPFKCEGVGRYPDPESCNLYHWCQYNAVGDLWDTVMKCDSGTVWCEDSEECLIPDVCPCFIF